MDALTFTLKWQWVLFRKSDSILFIYTNGLLCICLSLAGTSAVVIVIIMCTDNRTAYIIVLHYKTAEKGFLIIFTHLQSWIYEHFIFSIITIDTFESDGEYIESYSKTMKMLKTKAFKHSFQLNLLWFLLHCCSFFTFSILWKMVVY